MVKLNLQWRQTESGSQTADLYKQVQHKAIDPTMETLEMQSQLFDSMKPLVALLTNSLWSSDQIFRSGTFNTIAQFYGPY